ncbi:MAG: DUF58 domain-containing protein [Ktedonobacteraceae bacterium]
MSIDPTSRSEETQRGLNAFINRRRYYPHIVKKNVYEVQRDAESREDRTLSKRWYYLGGGLIVLGILFRQPLFVLVGLLLTLILAMIDIWSTYCLRNVSYGRTLSEKRVQFGEEITLSLTAENRKILPLPWLEVEDVVPRALAIKDQPLHASGVGNVFKLDCLFSLRWYDRVTRRYTIHCNTRGVHTFGPTRLRSGDVFGFVNREAEVESYQFVLVYPLIVPITRLGLPARHPFGDRRAPRRLLEDPSRVAGIRNYVYGDSLRRVNWKATARTMQMQSKVYEATTTFTIVLFLNASARHDNYYGIHPELQELSICATASLTDWAMNQSYAVGLYANSILYMPDEARIATVETDEQEEAINNSTRKERVEATVEALRKRRRVHVPASSNETQRQRIMEVLARIQPYFGTSIEDVLQAERTHLPSGATVVVITSSISDRLVDTLARVRQSGHAVSILFVSDSPLSIKIAGVTVYHIGGEDTWKHFEAAYRTGAERVVEDLPTLHL